MTNLKIGYPSMQLAACTANGTAATGYGLTNLCGGSRANTYQRSAATTDDQIFEYSSGTANYFALLRANLLKNNACSKVLFRSSNYSYSTPSTISGLRLWLDANKGITSSSALVSTWADQSGNGFNATASGAQRPTWTDQAINGNAALLFNNSSTIMLVDGVLGTFTGSDSPFSVFAVHKQATRADSNVIVSTAVAATTSSRFYIEGHDGVTSRRVTKKDDAASQVSQTAGTSTTNIEVFSVVCPGTTISAWIDGGNVLNAAAFDVGTMTSTNASIGALRTNGTTGNFYDGYIGEIIIYNKAVDATERGNIEGYLINKWKTAAASSATTFASQTLYGSLSEDYISAFSATSGTYGIVQEGVSSSSTYPQGKHFAGTFLDLGRDPSYGIMRKSDEKTKHARERAHIVELEWRGISDANKASFLTNIAGKKDVYDFVLYDPADALLDGYRMMHARLNDYDVEPEMLNSNKISAVFEELI